MTTADGDLPGGVVKVIELVGSSPKSFSDAVRNAVATAAQSIRNIQGVEVLSSSANVGADGSLTLYKVNCKLAFLVENAGVESLEDSGTSSSTAMGTVQQGAAEEMG
jgi:flavin-binding protein dodecin